jgi:cytochrome P450 PksS
MSSEAPAVDLNLVSPQNLINPVPLYHELRENDPVHWSPAVNAWFLTRYEDVSAAFRDSRLSAERSKFFEYQIQGLGPQVIEEFMRTIRLQMFMREGPDHVRLRRQTGTGFTPQKLDEMRPSVQRIMKELLERVYPLGRMDLVKDIAYQMPTLAIAELLGVPPEDRERFKVWSDALAAFSAPAVGADMTQLARDVNQAVMEMKQYLGHAVEQRRQTPGRDALSLMLQAQDAGRMSADELVANAILILFAGHTTLTDQLSNGVYDLLTHPEQLQKLRESPNLLGSAVEEMLRFTPAVPFVFRIAATTFELRGKTIRQGDMVFLSMSAANRDPSVFPEPDRFDITRDSYRQKHITFGFGPHHCMGGDLARRELEIGISTLFERMPQLRLDETRPPQPKIHGLTFRGFHSLPVAW